MAKPVMTQKCKSSNLNILRMKRLDFLKCRLLYKKEVMNLKADIHQNSHSGIIQSEVILEDLFA